LKDHSKSLDVGINVWPKMSSGITINGYHLNYLSMDGVDDKVSSFRRDTTPMAPLAGTIMPESGSELMMLHMA